MPASKHRPPLPTGARELIGAASPAVAGLAGAGPMSALTVTGIAAANVGMPMYTGRSNTIPVPNESAAAAGTPPSTPVPGSIIVQQVAERWVSEVSANLQPEVLGGYLRNAIAGDLFYLFEFFEEMEEKWPTLRGALMRHRLKVAMRELRIRLPERIRNPGLAKKKADHVGLVFGEIRNMEATLFNLTDCLTKGISLAEIDWQIGDIGGVQAVTVNEIKWVNYRHLGYWYDSPELRLFPNLLNRAAPIVPPERKFVCVEHLSKSGHPARASMLRDLAWYFLIYLYAIKDWSTLAETYGIDVAWATMRLKEPGTTEEQRNKALMHLSRIAARAGIFDEGTDIHIERASSTGAAPQEALVKYCNEKAVEVILGQTLTTITPTHGTQALGSVQQEEGDLVINWTALLVARALGDQAARWLCDYNFAERGDYPVIELPGANRRDLTALANIVNILVRVGVQVPESWARNQFEVPEPKIGADGQPEPLLIASQAAGEAPMGNALIGKDPASELTRAADFGSLTELQAQHALDALRSQAIRQGRNTGAFEKLLGPVKALLTGGGDPAELLGKLKAARAEMKPEELEGIAREMFVLADMVGRVSAKHHAGGHHA